MQPVSCKCQVSFIPNIFPIFCQTHEWTVWNLTLFPHCYFPSSSSTYSACVGFRSTLIIADDRRRHHRAERQRVEPTAELLRPRKQTAVMTGWKLLKNTTEFNALPVVSVRLGQCCHTSVLEVFPPSKVISRSDRAASTSSTSFSLLFMWLSEDMIDSLLMWYWGKRNRESSH